MATKAATRAKAEARRTRDDERLADEIIRDWPAVEAAKKPAKRIEANRKRLLEMLAPLADPDEELVAHGTLGDVVFSAAADGLECTDMRKVHRLLGDELFYELATVSMADLKAELTQLQLDSVTRPCRGARRMSVAPNVGLPGQDRVR